MRWLRAADILHCAIPNGARTSMTMAKRLKAEGMSAGAPDLLIFDAPPAAPEFIGAALELKHPGGRKPSEEQQDWLIALAARGWMTRVCYGAAEALRWLAELGYRVPG